MKLKFIKWQKVYTFSTYTCVHVYLFLLDETILLSRNFLMLQVIEEKSVVNLRCIPGFLEMQLLSALQIFI